MQVLLSYSSKFVSKANEIDVENENRNDTLNNKLKQIVDSFKNELNFNDNENPFSNDLFHHSPTLLYDYFNQSNDKKYLQSWIKIQCNRMVAS